METPVLICGMFNLKNAWTHQNTGKLLSGQGSTPDPNRGAYSAVPDPLMVERG